MKYLIPILLVTLFVVSGCAWSRTKVNDSAVVQRSQKIELGVTRGNDLAKIMQCVPSSVIQLKDGRMAYAFGYGEGKTEALSLIFLTLSKTNSYTSAVYVLVDKEGIVRGVARSPVTDVAWEFWPFGE